VRGSGLLVEPQKAESPLARSWFGFTAMCLGLFMAILDIQIVAAALPRIATALHTPLDS
jgi:MFS transporter, DHA2 family, multidrug resistance protein